MTQPQFSGAGSILLNARRADMREHLLAAGMRLKYAKDAEREAISIPDDYEGFLRTLWPSYLSDKSGRPVAMAEYHHAFWQWAWTIENGSRHSPFVAIWPRNGGKSTAAELLCAVSATRETRRYALYVGRSQDRADDHVATVAHMLEAAEVARANPAAANRMLGKYGNALAWRRSRLRTASRFTLDAIGLDVMARGAKIDEDRPDLLIFDDIDDEQDSVATVEKKIKTLTHAILPAGSEDAAILFVQNLVHPDSIASRLVDGRADFLALRRVSGPHKALRGMTFEQREGRFVITGGEPTWPAMGIARCQEEVDEIGMSAFLSELQHEVDVPPGGMYDHIVWRHIRWDEVPWGSLTDICVWVDPAVTDTDDSDAHGIQADARHSDGTIYRLYSWEDRTSPEDALMRAILKAIELGATRVGVETDQGGDVWRTSYEQSWTLLTAPEPNGSDSRLLQRRAEFAALRDTMLRERGQLVKKPAFVWDKAGAGYGGKVHRSAQMLADYERGHIIHVVGTHEILERALRRFPKTKPLDLADAAFWSWRDLQKTVSVWAA